jgi:putative two-component system response regulator
MKDKLISSNGPDPASREAENLSGERPGRILVVDDDEHVRKSLAEFLKLDGHEVVMASDGEQALGEVAKDPPDLVLLDLMMPGMDGLEVCRRLKAMDSTRLIPIVMVTALQDRGTKVKALEAGTDDFLGKPFNRVELQARVRSLLRLKRYTDELESVESVLFSLARSVEAKDAYTGDHCGRLSTYSLALGRWAGLSPEKLKALERGAILHDIGKVAIADAILLKPGGLTPDEFEAMKQHTLIGERICQPLRSLRFVLPIIRSHHERLDGSGYPDGLSRDAIPITARVLQIADIYDALTTKRPYKPACSPEEAFEILRSEAKKGWREEQLVEGLYEVLRLEGHKGEILI